MTEILPAADIDLAAIALFAPQPTSPPGRTRGGFSMAGEPRNPLEREVATQPAPPGEQAGRVALAPRVQRALEGEIDWDLVDVLRERVSAELSERDPDPAQRETVGREIIAGVLDEESRASTVRGQLTWTLEHQDRLAQALFDAVFRLGRLQPYLDDPSIENVIISGFDDVLVENSDGELVRAEPVASSDDQLIEYLDLHGRASTEAAGVLRGRLETPSGPPRTGAYVRVSLGDVAADRDHPPQPPGRRRPTPACGTGLVVAGCGELPVGGGAGPDVTGGVGGSGHGQDHDAARPGT